MLGEVTQFIQWFEEINFIASIQIEVSVTERLTCPSWLRLSEIHSWAGRPNGWWPYLPLDVQQFIRTTYKLYSEVVYIYISMNIKAYSYDIQFFITCTSSTEYQQVGGSNMIDV